MNLYFKIILILFGLAYLISPVDIIPDLLLPFVGWIDDGVVIATIYYLIRYGKLPNFFFKRKNPFKKQYGHNTESFTSNKKQEPHKNTRNKPSNSNRSFKTNPTPFEILGITPNASKQEIQNAYKQAVKKYHPDKLSHLGEEFSTLANEKFLAIQKAYDKLMKEHKF